MRELLGDSARGDDWAVVRLRVAGETIVDAEADGLAQELRGLTLLEAAAVGGERLPVDALANALGPAFRASPDPRRVAVGVSGGVDSAVALLKAGPQAVGVTLRLWLDPRGPDAERACCSPSAVVAARETCHALGLPHVTLDLREPFRRAVVEPFVRGYARGETPNPCIRCNGGFRFARLLGFARRAGASRLATGHYARIVERDGRVLLARAADVRKDQSYMLARVDPKLLGRIWFPLGEQTKEQTRAEAAAAGLAVAGRAESQEACFLAGGDYRDFLERHGADRRRRRPARRRARRLLAVHPRAASWPRRGGRRAALRGRLERAHEHRDGRAAARARAHAGQRPRPSLRACKVGDGEAPLPLTGRLRDGRGDRVRVPASARRARVRRGRRTGRRSLRRRRGGRVRAGDVRGGRVRSRPCSSCSRTRISPTRRSRCSSSPSASVWAGCSYGWP